MSCFKKQNTEQDANSGDGSGEQNDLQDLWSSLALTDMPPHSGSWLQKVGKGYLLRRFGKLQGGRLNVNDADGSQTMGCINDERDLDVRIEVLDQAFYLRTLFGGTIGSAESYIEGQWRVDDLTNLIRVLVRNIDSITHLDRTWLSLKKMGHWICHKLRRNTIQGSRKNIHEHYDLGNKFYQLFLDPTMNYSSGIFSRNAENMLQSSLFKMNWICEKLQLRPDDHVLEIGTGWGGLACFMAKNFGCRVTTTTISQAQFDYAQERVQQEGLQDRVTVLLQDLSLIHI